ncbi:TetR/AcrR family transcriptional regulator [Conexibacter woesei]|uniref:TetR/AcrR family transcriptional regulator n=1 Tax=Conexibacter woesei TaxID=191495 RepID=UPI0003F71EE5|nr:TetR/AcrR family transcriptional regulator [Conexibacter woesei]
MSSDESFPVPPWSAAATRGRAASATESAPAKAPLTRVAIVAAALELLDADGLDGVSMRRVAQKLETGPASLYQHVGNKDELLEAVLDRVCAAIDVPAPGAGPDGWQEPLKELLRRMRKVIGAHQDLAYIMLGRVPTGPNALAGAEGMLAILDAGGITGRLAAQTVDLLALFVASVTYEDAIRRRLIGTVQEAEVYVEQVGAYLRALPGDRFPMLNRLADVLTTFDEDTEDAGFEFALDVQIRGIAALAAQARAAG